MESHTSIAAWGEFSPTLDNIVVLTMLPLYIKKNAMGMTLGENGTEKLEYRKFSLTRVKSSGKATYTSWICFFDEKERTGWFSWFVLSSGSEDGHNNFVFPLAILSLRERFWPQRQYSSGRYARLEQEVSLVPRRPIPLKVLILLANDAPTLLHYQSRGQNTLPYK